jgi:hypothetical protein
MRLSPASRFLAALIALCCMLFTQLALASYVCPADGFDGGAQIDQMLVAASDHDATACADMDPVQPSLCHAHEQAGTQSLDKPSYPIVQPFVATGFASSVTTLAPAYRPETPPAASRSLARATSPPIAIRHCCLRI